jgi:DNA-binding transcriptional regulator of glucitol operon
MYPKLSGGVLFQGKDKGNFIVLSYSYFLTDHEKFMQREQLVAKLFLYFKNREEIQKKRKYKVKIAFRKRNISSEQKACRFFRSRLMDENREGH